MTDPAQVTDRTPAPAPGSFYAPQDTPPVSDPAPAPTEAPPAAAPAPVAALQVADPEVDPAVLPTPDDIFDTLNHFDELAIKRAFREPVTSLDQMGGGRAMWFTLLRRSGVDDQTALDTVLKAPWRDVKANFRTVADDDDQADEVSRPEA